MNLFQYQYITDTGAYQRFTIDIAFDIVDEPKRALKAWRRSASAAGGPRSQL